MPISIKPVVNLTRNINTIMEINNKSPVPTSPALKPLHITSPSVVTFDKCSYNVDCSYEHDSLLARTRLGGRPVLPLPANHNNNSNNNNNNIQTESDWHVIKVLDGLVCGARHHMLELVCFKRVNFGLRWRDVRETSDRLPPTCMMGPHYVLMLATWLVFCFLATLVNVLTFDKAGRMEIVAGVFLSTMCLTCYALVGCTNPGIVTRIDVPLDDTFTYCDHCDSYRPEGALHCMDCRVCIEEYDHHCPWTGKCVGKRNVRYFYAWLLFMVLAFVYEVIEFTTYLFPADGQDPLDDDSLDIILSP